MIRNDLPPDLAVGDTVLYRRTRIATPVETKIIRLGRTYAYVMVWGQERAFRKDSGIDRDHLEAMSGSRIITQQMIDREAEIDAVFARLAKFGIDSWRILPQVNNLSTLVRVAETLEADATDD